MIVFEHNRAKSFLHSNLSLKDDSKTLGSKRSLELHIASVHKGWKPFLCSNCNLSFTLKANLKKLNVLVYQKKKPFNALFVISASLEKNMLKVIVFLICNQGFSRKIHLMNHNTFVHEAENPIQCHKCNATFQRKWSLTRHFDEVHNQKEFTNELKK